MITLDFSALLNVMNGNFFAGFFVGFLLGLWVLRWLTKHNFKESFELYKRINHLRSENNILQTRIDSLRREVESQKELNYELKSALKKYTKGELGRGGFA